MKTLSSLAEQIIEEWAKPKGLCDRTQAQALAQYNKTVEEVGELLEAIEAFHEFGGGNISTEEEKRGMLSEICLEAGDVLATLAIQSEIQGCSLEKLIETATYYCSRESINGLEWEVESLEVLVKSSRETMARMQIGTIAIALETLIKPFDLTLIKCLGAAWEKIRDRRSVTIQTPHSGSVAVKSAADYQELCRVHGMAVDLDVVRSLEPENLPSA
jgi:NTP pyrophosphatase (non-canonical NTP hydrolase)